MITPPVPSQPITKEGMMVQSYMLWTQAVTKLQPIIGTGSPEGAVEADQYSFYIDSTGTTGSILWCKMLPLVGADRKMGWVLI
jgi:hypothetical protein